MPGSEGRLGISQVEEMELAGGEEKPSSPTLRRVCQERKIQGQEDRSHPEGCDCIN